MIFVLFFSLSGAKVQFIIILYNLIQNKSKNICFITQNLFFGHCVKRKDVELTSNNWDPEYPIKTVRNHFDKMTK